MSERHEINISFDDDGNVELDMELLAGTTRDYIIHVTANTIATILKRLAGRPERLEVAKQFFIEYLEEACESDQPETEEDQ